MRTRLLVQALIGVLMITGALVIRGSEVTGHRTGALFLLLSGALFVTVVVIDSAQKLRSGTEEHAAAPNSDSPTEHAPAPIRVRRVRPDGTTRRGRSGPLQPASFLADAPSGINGTTNSGERDSQLTSSR